MNPGVRPVDGSTRFAVRAPLAGAIDLCLFRGEAEQRVAMTRAGEDWTVSLPGDLDGTRYGYRTHGEWAPERGLWFDPAKLLVDPRAVELDRPFVQDPLLARHGAETAAVVPRAIVRTKLPDMPLAPPRFTHGGLIYELNVRGFTMRHPEVPEDRRGTVAALAHPAVLAHFGKLKVNAVELMPLVAWIDERHLPPLGLSNAWGYNPVVPMALDPRLCPGGVAELAWTVARLHEAGIGVILDIVLNHTGESDAQGGVLALRGLDAAAYARAPNGSLVNDTGCGNTLDFANPAVRSLALDALRHFVRHCGVDGFRFDLATVLARGPGFDAAAPFFGELAADPWLSGRVLIAEPWDIGPGGYRLGQFPTGWLEWNDRFRDDVRRFWRGDLGPGPLAMRLAGSSDIFGANNRSVNFLAAHDGFTLADIAAYRTRHNHANGEENRDGHGENFSWNHGVEGPSDDLGIRAKRDADRRAMLGTLFASSGSIMLAAGDEFGRSQQGNNNAYCQDNELTWIDWEHRDRALEDHVAGLAARRAAHMPAMAGFPEDGAWLDPDGAAMTPAKWEDPATDGFDFRPAPGDTHPGLQIRRHERIARFRRWL